MSSLFILAFFFIPDGEITGANFGRPRAAGGGGTDYATGTYNVWAHYKLEDGVGVCDDEEGANDLVEQGTLVHNTDRKQGSYSAGSNGSNANRCGTTLSSATPWNDTNDFAFAAWILPDEDPTNESDILQLGSNNETEVMERGTAARFRLRLGGSSFNPSSFTYTVGVWQHIVVSWDNTATDWTVYLNGGTAGTCTGAVATSGTNHTADSSDLLKLHSGTDSWDHSVDDVVFWTQTWSADDACDLYQQGCAEGTDCNP